MNDSSTSRPDLRKILMYGTIATLVVCAIIGIVAIFLDTAIIPLNLVSTLLIFYLIAFLSARSLMLVNNKSIAIQSLAVISLIMNCCWAIPWILLIWDAFGSMETHARIIIWQLLWTAGVVAVSCMIFASCLANVQNMDRKKKLENSLPLTITGFAAIDLLIIIWSNDIIVVADILWKFFLSEVILVLLQVIVTQILSTDAKRRQKESADAEKEQRDAKLRAMWAKNLQEQDQSQDQKK